MEQQLTRFEALCLAVERAGSQEKLGEALGVTQSAVSQWISRSKQLPAEHVLRVEMLFGVSRHDSRPDIYPRGLVDGVPYTPEEPLLDVFADVTLPPRQARQAARDQGTAPRLHAVDRRAGAHA